MKPKTPIEVKAVTIKANLTSTNKIEKLYQMKLGVLDTIYCLYGIMSQRLEDNFDLSLKVHVLDVLTSSSMLISKR